MPFQSKAQARFMFSQHPDMAKRWAAETPSIKSLPEHKKKKPRLGMAKGVGVSSKMKH